MHDLSENLLGKIKRSLIFWAAAAVVIAGDQASKIWILANLAPNPGEPGYEIGIGLTRMVTIIPRLLRFQYAENTGAAFSMFEQHPEILTIIACSLAVGVIAWSFFLPAGEQLSRLALGLVFGGAVGNIVDRFQHGFVVDFIQLHWDGRPLYPTFNIADSAICVGIGVFFIASWLAYREQSKQSKEPGAAREPGRDASA